jgi:glycosyltransferase involved in cell wall biosynthesis
MKRIAFCSPVNPQASGISDYSEELLPFLAQYAEIVLFVERSVEPTNPALRRHLQVEPLDQLPALARKPGFDAILYHMGNSPLHAEIYEQARRVPGVVVLHDLVLHHFQLWYAATRGGDVETYIAELCARYGARGEAVGRRMVRGQLLDAAFDMPMVEELLEHASGIIAHSQFVVDRVRAVRANLPVTVVPMGVPLSPGIPKDVARSVLELPPEAPIWASFGHINPYKRMEAALRAFRRFRALEPDALYLLVGSVSPSFDLDGLIRRLNLADSVTVTGYVPPPAFEHYVAASDLCLNLRAPTAGETSASLLRLLGAGKPTLVTAIDAMDELPADVCARVDLGPAEGDQILAYARLMRLRPALAARLGENARRYVSLNHSLEGAARGYMEFLARLYGWEPPTSQHMPLWSIGETEPSPPGTPRQAHASPDIVTTHQGDRVAGDVDGAESIAQLARDVGMALAGLGVEPQDRAVLEDTSRIIVDLAREPRLS